MDRLLLTVAESAEVLGIGRSKLYEMLRAGELPSVQFGFCRRIAVPDLHAFIAARRLAATSGPPTQTDKSCPASRPVRADRTRP